METTDGAAVVFDTASIPAHLRREFFRDGLADTLGRFEVDSPPGVEMRQVFRMGGGPDSAIVTVDSSAVRMRRLAESNADDDVITYNLVRSGTVIRQSQLRRSVEARPGEGFLDVLYETLDFSAPDSHSIEWVTLSRRRLATRVADVEAAALTVRNADPTATALLSSYVSILKASPPEPGALADRVVEHLHDLVALVLGPTRDGAGRASAGVRAARRAAIVRHIDRSLSDPGLNAQSIALRFGLTDRYIRMLFEADGGIWAHIARKRIDLAARMLADPSMADVKIVDVAFRCGFNSISVFNRLFLQLQGCRPSSMR